MSESTMSGSPPRLRQPARRIRIEEVHFQHRGAGHSVHRQIVDADQMRRLQRRFRARGRHLAPAAGRRTEIDHAHARLQQMVFVVDLDQLVGGARAIALRLRALE